MARQFVNLGAEQAVRDAITALGGEATFTQVRDALIASGQSALVRDILGLHTSGRIPGIVRAQPEGPPALYLMLTAPAAPNQPNAGNQPATPATPAQPSAPANPVG
jgi:hypothetical protein